MALGKKLNWRNLEQSGMDMNRLPFRASEIKMTNK
jgi:hypothetical protein